MNILILDKVKNTPAILEGVTHKKTSASPVRGNLFTSVSSSVLSKGCPNFPSRRLDEIISLYPIKESTSKLVYELGETKFIEEFQDLISQLETEKEKITLPFMKKLISLFSPGQVHGHFNFTASKGFCALLPLVDKEMLPELAKRIILVFDNKEWYPPCRALQAYTHLVKLKPDEFTSYRLRKIILLLTKYLVSYSVVNAFEELALLSKDRGLLSSGKLKLITSFFTFKRTFKNESEKISEDIIRLNALKMFRAWAQIEPEIVNIDNLKKIFSILTPYNKWMWSDIRKELDAILKLKNEEERSRLSRELLRYLFYEEKGEINKLLKALENESQDLKTRYLTTFDLTIILPLIVSLGVFRKNPLGDLKHKLERLNLCQYLSYTFRSILKKLNIDLNSVNHETDGRNLYLKLGEGKALVFRFINKKVDIIEGARRLLKEAIILNGLDRLFKQGEMKRSFGEVLLEEEGFIVKIKRVPPRLKPPLANKGGYAIIRKVDEDSLKRITGDYQKVFKEREALKKIIEQALVFALEDLANFEELNLIYKWHLYHHPGALYNILAGGHLDRTSTIKLIEKSNIKWTGMDDLEHLGPLDAEDLKYFDPVIRSGPESDAVENLWRDKKNQLLLWCLIAGEAFINNGLSSLELGELIKAGLNFESSFEKLSINKRLDWLGLGTEVMTKVRMGDFGSDRTTDGSFSMPILREVIEEHAYCQHIDFWKKTIQKASLKIIESYFTQYIDIEPKPKRIPEIAQKIFWQLICSKAITEKYLHSLELTPSMFRWFRERLFAQEALIASGQIYLGGGDIIKITEPKPVYVIYRVPECVLYDKELKPEIWWGREDKEFEPIPMKKLVPRDSYDDRYVGEIPPLKEKAEYWVTCRAKSKDSDWIWATNPNLVIEVVNDQSLINSREGSTASPITTVSEVKGDLSDFSSSGYGKPLQVLFGALGWDDQSYYYEVLAPAVDLMGLDSSCFVVDIGPNKCIYEPVSVAVCKAKVTVVQPENDLRTKSNLTKPLKNHIRVIRERVKELTGVDIEKYISYVNGLMEDANIKSNSVNAIIMMNVSSIASDREKLFDSVISAIKKDGYILHGASDVLLVKTECQLFEEYCRKKRVRFKIVREFHVAFLDAPAYKLYQIERKSTSSPIENQHSGFRIKEKGLSIQNLVLKLNRGLWQGKSGGPHRGWWSLALAVALIVSLVSSLILAMNAPPPTSRQPPASSLQSIPLCLLSAISYEQLAINHKLETVASSMGGNLFITSSSSIGSQECPRFQKIDKDSLRKISQAKYSSDSFYKRLPAYVKDRIYKGMSCVPSKKVFSFIQRGIPAPQKVSCAKEALLDILFSLSSIKKTGNEYPTDVSSLLDTFAGDPRDRTFIELLDDFGNTINYRKWILSNYRNKDIWFWFSLGGRISTIRENLIEGSNFRTSSFSSDGKIKGWSRERYGRYRNELDRKIGIICDAIQSTTVNSKIAKKFSNDGFNMGIYDRPLLIEIDQNRGVYLDRNYGIRIAFKDFIKESNFSHGLQDRVK
ncbi:MAG: hypothetical protein KJ711_08605, partial [Candidatus Omnitrophica bacterium]|nr:hypothetical protein [Candidatus Omnitrophota bacterium]